jgi:hypothetical protein
MAASGENSTAIDTLVFAFDPSALNPHLCERREQHAD